MSIRILTKNGIDNTNIDGARDHNFNAGRRSGIVKGVLNEGKFFIITSNIVCLDSCELRLFGHRIVIEEAITHTLAGTPSTAIRYSFIAQVIVDDNFNVSFSTFIQLSSKELIQDNLDKTGKGTYQLEIGKFTQLSDGTLTDVTRTADLITGGDGSGDSEYIRIGTVTTNKISPELDADVDIENTINPDDNKPQTNFTFNLPTPSGTVVSIAGEEKTSINTDTTPTANSQNLVTSGGVHDYPAISFAEGEYQKSKNLFNENKYLSSYCTYASNRWTTNSTRIGYNQSILTNEVGATSNRNTSKLPLLKKGTYTLTMFNAVNNTNDTTINIALYNQDGTINGTFTTATITTNTTIMFTLASDLYLDIRVSGDVGTISFDHIQVEEGSVATDYRPYYGEITHNGDTAVEFAESEYQKSKNLFDAPNIPLPTGVTYNSNTNTFTYTSDEVAEGATAFAQLNNVVMPAGNYVYSFNSTSTITGDTTYIVAKLTSTGAFESGLKTIIAPAGKVSIPFTLTEDTYIGLCWYYKTGWSEGSAPAGSKTISNVQLEQGSTATDYQPYYGAIVHQGDIAPVVLYDKNSANANINWGYTNGISASTGITLEDKDFNGYSRLRCYFKTEGTRDGIYSGAFIVDVDLTEQVNSAGDNNYYCGIASTVTPYSLTTDNYFEIAICRVGVDSTKSKITFGEYGWNKTAVVGRGTPCYKIEGIK